MAGCSFLRLNETTQQRFGNGACSDAGAFSIDIIGKNIYKNMAAIFVRRETDTVCAIDFPIWDQAAKRPKGFRVTRFFGTDYLLPADLEMKYSTKLDLERVWIISDCEIQAELVAVVEFLGTKRDPVEIPIPVLLKTKNPIGSRLFDPNRPDYHERVIGRLARLKTRPHVRNLRQCLAKSMGRRQILNSKLRRSVPRVIVVR